MRSAAQQISEAAGKPARLSDLLDELVHRALPGLLKVKLEALRAEIDVQ